MSGECIDCGCDSYELVCWNCKRITELEQQLKEANEVIEKIYITKDHMSYENKWISYNTGFLRSLARQYLTKYKVKE